MADRRPAVRAGTAQDSLRFIDRFRPGGTAAVIARLTPDIVDVYESLGRTDWIPIAQDRFFVEAMHSVLGTVGLRENVRRATAIHVETPLLAAVLEGAKRVFGLTPAGIFSMVPRAWPLIYRDVATIRVENTGERSLRVVFDDVAPELSRTPAYFLVFDGVFLGLLDIARAPGQLKLTLDAKRTRAEWAISW